MSECKLPEKEKWWYRAWDWAGRVRNSERMGNISMSKQIKMMRLSGSIYDVKFQTFVKQHEFSTGKDSSEKVKIVLANHLYDV